MQIGYFGKVPIFVQITVDMLTVKPPFSNMQVELLKLYAAGVPDEMLPEIKELIARFLLSRAKDEAGKIWVQKGYDETTIERWKSGDHNSES